MNALAARRRHPAAVALLILFALIATGSVYAALAPKPAAAATASGTDAIEEGHNLFLANCATCHGANAEGKKTGNGDNVAGPSLVGVGAASVDFQMGTGRMPMAAPSVQAPANTRASKRAFTQEQIDQIGAYVASLAPGPSVPSAEDVSTEGGDAGRGGEIFRVNCAMCHNFAGSGGALTRGKSAPALNGVTPTHI
ncbi:MAG: c-type cytochrome, partial [Nostocoides sp.]